MPVPYRPVLIAACGLALGAGLAACQMDKPQTAPGPNYQAPVARANPPANLPSVCFVDPDLAAFRARMEQQELVIDALSCTVADGNRKLDKQCAAFIAKFTTAIASN